MDKAKIVAEKETLTITEFEMPIDEFTKNGPKAGDLPSTTTVMEFEDPPHLHSEVLNAFAAAILRGEPLIADGREGLKETTLANAIYLSDWLGRPVELPLDEKRHLKELKKRVKHSKLRTVVNPEDASVDHTDSSRDRWRVKW